MGKPTIEEIERLIWHYDDLLGDTTLLVQYAGAMHRTLSDAFRDCVEAVADLQAQAKEMRGK